MECSICKKNNANHLVGGCIEYPMCSTCWGICSLRIDMETFGVVYDKPYLVENIFKKAMRESIQDLFSCHIRKFMANKEIAENSDFPIEKRFQAYSIMKASLSELKSLQLKYINYENVCGFNVMTHQEMIRAINDLSSLFDIDFQNNDTLTLFENHYSANH